ncbi:unnamed protein product [Mesocestoides corti]|uniref:Uncharacterized protein n=1 Tax=Mesocestoides corti TaxID=53468 RepID=A0A0R3UM82_MESCO|nr:unnamed protein product [Mesocestoides corti]
MVPTPHLISVPSTASSIPYPVGTSSFIPLAPPASTSSAKPVVGKPPEICHYHLIFGPDSKQCIPPCSFQSEDIRKVSAPTSKPVAASAETTNVGTCRYHKTYGPRSEKCEQPCIYRKEKKDPISCAKSQSNTSSAKESTTAPMKESTLSSSSSREVCFFHRTYGLGSVKCQPPCVLSPHNATSDEADVAKKSRRGSTSKSSLTPSSAAVKPDNEVYPGASHSHTIYVPVPSKRRRVELAPNDTDGFELTSNGASDICPHHRQFGEKAVECVPPCKFHKSRLSASETERGGSVSDSTHKSLSETDSHYAHRGRYRSESTKRTSPYKYSSKGLSAEDIPAPCQQRPSNSPQAQSPGLCVYHNEFGDNAKLCYPPCSYKPSTDNAYPRRHDDRESSTRSGESRETSRHRSPVFCRYHQQFGDAARNCQPPCDYASAQSFSRERQCGLSST